MSAVIGVTFSKNIKEADKKAYLEAFEEAGFDAKQLYPDEDRYDAAEVGLHGLILLGGGDIHPCFYGEANRCSKPPDEERDQREQDLFRLAREEGIPILGVCRGIQVVNVFMGGSLYQDLATEIEAPVPAHGRDRNETERMHPVRMKGGSKLARVVGSAEISVNSYHHQAIKGLAEGLEPVGWTEDGVVEAVEAPGEPIFGVQWHPERLAKGERSKLFRWFYQLCLKKK